MLQKPNPLACSRPSLHPSIGYMVGCCWLLLALACGHGKRSTTTRHQAPKTKPPVAVLPAPAPLTGFADTVTVAKAQLLLNLLGYNPGKADGQMKEQTAVALTAFQSDNQLPNGDRTDTTLQKLGVPLFNFGIDSLQRQLSKKGYDPGPIDGLLGPMTRGAFKEFVRTNKLPANRLSPETRDALFSNTYQYDKPPADLLQYDTANNATYTHFYAGSISIANVTVSDIRRALAARGYPTNDDTNNAVTPPLEDALYLFQQENKLPMGGFNTETLRSLGFR